MFFSCGIFAQKLTLKAAAKDTIENSVLNLIDYKKTHIDKKSVNNEIDRLSNYLKQLGYFRNTVDSISKIDSTFVAYFRLENKIEKAVIRIPKDFNLELSGFTIKNNTLIIPIEKLQQVLESVSKKLDRKGRSFSEVQLKNIHIKNNNLFADLSVNQSKERKIDDVIIKGYEGFSKSYIRHYLNIKKGMVFNQQKLIEISSSIKSLKFVSEIKPPEVLFTKDSTTIYIYIKKQKNNSFDGLVNFASTENGGVLFNGHLDLKLINILNTGESFKLLWNSIAKERQDFNISTEIPYIFNSFFSPEASFTIYKQDSTFLNTKFHTGISYSINSKAKISLTYDSENSENLKEDSVNTIKTFNNSFLGVGFSYKIPDSTILFEDLFNISINTSFGNRKTENDNTKQIKAILSASYIWGINSRNSFFIKNETGYLNSDNFIDNELFRIGGANSIRGFNEQSIFTAKYSYFNTEYRYTTSQTGYLFSITDFGSYQETQSNNNPLLLALGLGYSFKVNSNTFKLSYVNSRTSETPFSFKNSQILVNWVTFF